MKKMMIISLSATIKSILQNIKLGCIYTEVSNSGKNDKLWSEIDQYVAKISNFTTEQIKQIPQIANTRVAYKTLGKEPSRYRPSAEALMRRIILNKSLYNVNTVVDTINLASIATGYSIGGYDASKIMGDIVLDRANKHIEYESIGRGKLNIEGLPVLFDDIGAFGSPTSDSFRTSIDLDTKNILIVVFNFGVLSGFENDLNFISELFVKYTNSKNIQIQIFD